MTTKGKIRRTTNLPGDPDRTWIGVREDDRPLVTHNLFIPMVDDDFVKGDDIEWDDEKVYFKSNEYELLQISPGVVSSIILKPSFRP